MMARYGTLRKKFLLRLPADLWDSLDIMRRGYCKLHGEVSMNAWLESILMDRVREERMK